jgi:hypothetical protein
MKTIRAHTKSTVLFFRTFEKKYLSRETISLGKGQFFTLKFTVLCPAENGILPPVYLLVLLVIHFPPFCLVRAKCVLSVPENVGDFAHTAMHPAHPQLDLQLRKYTV